MTSPALVPASQFEVRKLSSFRVQLSASSYCLVGGWALFDKLRRGIVASNTKIDGRSVAAPMTFRTKTIALAVCSGGLIEGYPVVQDAATKDIEPDYSAHPEDEEYCDHVLNLFREEQLSSN